MIRKLTEHDISAIIGTNVDGYTIENARIKGGRFTDSDHYGILLGKNAIGNYVTWQFGNHEVGTVGGSSVRWQTISQERFDSKALKTEQPNLYLKYTDKSSYRRLTIKAAS